MISDQISAGTSPGRPSSTLRQLWVLMTTAFIDQIGFLMIVPILPYYAAKLGAKPALIGALFASFSLAQLLSAPYWGRFSDRYGRRPMLLIGLFASAVAFTLFAVADNIWILFLSRLVQGAGGGTTGVAQAYISDSMAPEERAQGLGWLSAATNLGVMVGPGLGLFTTHLGPRAPGFVAAALCLVNIAFTWYWLPESRRRDEGAAPRPRQSLRAAVGEVIAHPGTPVASLVWVYAVGMMAFSAMSSMLALYLQKRFGIDDHSIQWFFMYNGAIAVIMRAILLGPIVRRYGELAVLRIGTLAMMAGFALFPLARPCSERIPGFGWVPCGWGELAFVALFVPIGMALLFPATTALVSRRGSQSETGQVLGVQQAFGGVCKVLGPIWAGLAFQRIGIFSPFWISALLMLGVSVLSRRLTDEEGRQRRPAAVGAPS